MKLYIFSGLSGEFLRSEDIDSTLHIRNLLKKGFAVEVWKDHGPMANYQDQNIRTDSDGFAGWKF